MDYDKPHEYHEARGQWQQCRCGVGPFSRVHILAPTPTPRITTTLRRIAEYNAAFERGDRDAMVRAALAR